MLEIKLSCRTIFLQFKSTNRSNILWCSFWEDIHIDFSIWVVVIEKNSLWLFERWCFIALICSKLFHVIMNLLSRFNASKFVCWTRTNSQKAFKIFLYFIVNFVWYKLLITRRLMSLTCSWMLHIVSHHTHVRSLKIKQKSEIMIIYRFFMFRRSDLVSLASMMKRKKDNKRDVRFSISAIIVAEFVFDELMSFAFQLLKCLFLNIERNSLRYSSCSQLTKFNTSFDFDINDRINVDFRIKLCLCREFVSTTFWTKFENDNRSFLI